MAYIKICNRVFKVINSISRYNDVVERISHHRYNSIYDAYTRPSQKKINIYNEWLNWDTDIWQATNIHIMENLRIIGKNSDVFSLAMWLVIDNIYVVLHITADNNYAYVVANSCKKQLLRRYEA